MLKYRNRTVTKNRDVYQTVENCTDASLVATVIFHNTNCPEDGGFVVVSTCASCLKVSWRRRVPLWRSISERTDLSLYPMSTSWSRPAILSKRPPTLVLPLQHLSRDVRPKYPWGQHYPFHWGGQRSRSILPFHRQAPLAPHHTGSPSTSFITLLPKTKDHVCRPSDLPACLSCSPPVKVKGTRMEIQRTVTEGRRSHLRIWAMTGRTQRCAPRVWTLNRGQRRQRRRLRRLAQPVVSRTWWRLLEKSQERGCGPGPGPKSPTDYLSDCGGIKTAKSEPDVVWEEKIQFS